MTNKDVGFANALLADLNNPALFHGLHVPLGMKFGGWTDTIFEVLIKDSSNNLTPPVEAEPNGPEGDLAVADATIAIDDAELPGAMVQLA